MSNTPVLDQAMLDALMPPEKSDDFFDALYGEAEEGAYTIKLALRSVSDTEAKLALDLHQRTDKCLVCSLTYGLPQVFQRHPIINLAGVTKEVARALQWDENAITWTLGRTEEKSPALHSIPLIIKK